MLILLLGHFGQFIGDNLVLRDKFQDMTSERVRHKEMKGFLNVTPNNHVMKFVSRLRRERQVNGDIRQFHVHKNLTKKGGSKGRYWHP